MLATRSHSSDFNPFFDFDDSEFESGLDGMNWYVYCGNNPLGFVDPSGFAEESKYEYTKKETTNEITPGVLLKGKEYTAIRLNNSVAFILGTLTKEVLSYDKAYSYSPSINPNGEASNEYHMNNLKKGDRGVYAKKTF